MQKNKIFDQ